MKESTKKQIINSINKIENSIFWQLIVIFFFLFLFVVVVPIAVLSSVLNQYHLLMDGNSTIANNVDIASMHVNLINGFIMALLTFVYVILTGNLLKQSKKEQQIRDIENKLEKFYIPADEILNNSQTNKNRNNTLNGHPAGSYDPNYVIGLIHLRKYSYLADKAAFKAYEKYIKNNCKNQKGMTCQDNFNQFNDRKCPKESGNCWTKWDKCELNFEKCEHFNKCPKKNQDETGIIFNTFCENYIDLKNEISKDIESYKEELLNLKT